ncbi:MAG: SPASM domain-containing protein [Magnetococcales bacterium]|nr:SPASM domain-containing protein [Magnetococcales bacterium]
MIHTFQDGSRLLHHLEELYRWQQGEPFPPLVVVVAPTLPTLPALLTGLGNMGVKGALLAGVGEPLPLERCGEALRAGQKAGLELALHLEEHPLSAAWFQECAPTLDWLRRTLPDADPEPFWREMARAVQMRREGRWPLRLGILQEVTLENGPGLEASIRRAEALGVDFFQALPAGLPPGQRVPPWDPAWLQRIASLSTGGMRLLFSRALFEENHARDYERCLGLPFVARIAADGKVYACEAHAGEPAFCYGDVNREDFPTIWRGSGPIRDRITREWEVRTRCVSCCHNHGINQWLWRQTHPPVHIHFI